MADFNNICKLNRDECTNCGACYNICPVQAITQEKDANGVNMQYPVVDKEKCTNCGLCVKVCPCLTPVKTTNYKKPDCYAVMASDEIRAKSSSGGAFTILAEYILDKGGYVCGAAYRDDWSVHHIIIDKKEDLELLRGSKYVTSDMENVFKDIKELLTQDKYVLFTGCPCQVAGLNNYLGKKYDKLYTVDLLCHGAPDYRVFKKYLEENFKIDEIENLKFRDKSQGWSCSSLAIYKKDGDLVIRNKKQDPYQDGFHPMLFNHKSCSPCKYTKLPRHSDFSIADYWGIEKIKPEMYDKKGTSFLCTNNEKAVSAFNELKSRFYKYEYTPLEEVKKLDLNPLLYRAFAIHHKNREKFFKYFDKLSFKKNVDMCINGKYDVCMVTNGYAMNYGSALVNYAIHKVVESFGYSVLTLEKPRHIWRGHPNFRSGIVPSRFGKKHYNLSEELDEEGLIRLNTRCDTFIIGSDQILSPGIKFNVAYLDFALNCKNKIAFGSSFGHETYNVPPMDLLRNSFYLKRFNHIALREKIDSICDLLGIDAIGIIDPTLILPVEEYIKLADEVDMNIKKPYILTYILDNNPDKDEAVKRIAKELDLDIINLTNLNPYERKKTTLKMPKNDYSVEEFLYLYKNASFVFTDSFHGTCFSIKFNKPFVSIFNNNRGMVRFKLFENMGLMHRFFYNAKEIINTNVIFEDVDFTKANAFVKEKAQFACDWLKNAIENNTNDLRYTEYENFQDYALKELQMKFYNTKTRFEILDREDRIRKQRREKYSLKNILNKIFSVTSVLTHNKTVKHKVITVLGIKFKFRCQPKVC